MKLAVSHKRYPLARRDWLKPVKISNKAEHVGVCLAVLNHYWWITR